MADWVTISSLATAGGTLVLAVATFSSVKSANRSARTAERALLAGVKPLLVTSQGAVRDPGDPDYDNLRRAITDGRRVLVDILYGDHEDGQRTIGRFGISPWDEVEGEPRRGGPVLERRPRRPA